MMDHDFDAVKTRAGSTLDMIAEAVEEMNVGEVLRIKRTGHLGYAVELIPCPSGDPAED